MLFGMYVTVWHVFVFFVVLAEKKRCLELFKPVCFEFKLLDFFSLLGIYRSYVAFFAKKLSYLVQVNLHI